MKKIILAVSLLILIIIFSVFIYGINHTKAIPEALMTQDGKFLYNEKSDLTHEVTVDNGTVTFELESNPATFLSSSSESYLPGHVIRAFFIKTEIDDSNFVFAFVIRTNP